MICRWYKQSIIYSLDVETFKDGNGDGIGDFQGLTQSCRYLSALGVDCVWLLPFFPTPNRDNGYDVMDYYAVDPRLGTLGDFVEFMHEARNHHLRVIIDLAINHTSIQHPWFEQARRSRDNPFHNYYVWRYDEPPDTSDKAVFPPEQKSIWTYVPEVKGWYLHRFFTFQPDLNIRNPEVRAEMKKIIAFWLQLDIAGFRVDAVPFLLEHQPGDGTLDDHEFQFLEDLRDFASWHKGDSVLLGEANVSLENQLRYFGDGDRMHMVFNFLVNQHLFLSLARGSAKPLAESLAQMPELPRHANWAMFLRNHDELSLSRLTEEERQECFRKFAPEEHMRAFGRGIRRRLASILGNDRQKILFAHSLMFTLPGTPVLWYGEEIGMGENFDLSERWAVRTPMQWSSEENAGFSTASSDELVCPVISAGPHSYQEMNVQRQEREKGSLLSAVQQMIRVRQHNPEFGCGCWQLLQCDAGDKVLAYQAEDREQVVAALHNFTEEAQAVTVTFDYPHKSGVASDLLGTQEHELKEGKCRFELEPWGYRWVRLRAT